MVTVKPLDVVEEIRSCFITCPIRLVSNALPLEHPAFSAPEFRAPAISLPKGGGAIRGTGSMSVPIATSPGRSGFGTQLSLAYDSGASNGPYGLGWSLSGLNNRAENSYQPIRVREKVMRRFKSARQLQRFASIHDQVANLFMPAAITRTRSRSERYAPRPSRLGKG